MIKNTFISLVVLFLASLTAYAQKEIILTEKAPQPAGPYSQGVLANNMLFVAGQLGFDPVSRKLIPGGLEKELPQIMENIRAILAVKGLDLSHIVNTTIYIKDLGQFAKVNELYGAYFNGEFPARTTVGVASIPAGAEIEVTVIAAIPQGKRKK